ncbi:MAG: phenylalanine--tRNA ligase subunit beta [Thermoproteales archaeon]|nr:phenylalanine--tRNA ligase subunit beta [Thermoproteales archaeon]
MPVIEISRFDLEKLLGISLSDDQIEYYLPMLKCEIEEVDDDLIIYEATHDRPDLYSVEGLSRALRGILGIETELPIFNSKVEFFKCISDGPSYRPVALFATVHNVRLDDEAIKQMMQLQEKLHTTYCRNRRKVSIGIYDLDKITPPVKYMGVKPEDASFVPLDMNNRLNLKEILEKHPKGIEYAHLVKDHGYFPLLIDSKGKILSFPPIVNSEDTKVDLDTKNLFIDVTSTDLQAAFKVLSIVATSLYERGDYIGLIKTVLKNNNEVVSPDLSYSIISVKKDTIERLLGVNIDSNKIIELLGKMRFSASIENDKEIQVKVPPYRADILHEVDIVEDILMAYGYDNVEPVVMRPLHPGREDGLEFFTRHIRELLVGYGFQEVNNYMLTNKEVIFSKMGLEEQPVVEVKNPKQETYSCIRTWIIPQLIRVLSNSKHADYPQKIFEAGDVAIPDLESPNGVREEKRLAIAMTDSKVSFTDIYAVLDSIMKKLNLKFILKRAVHRSFIKGRVAEILVNKSNVGIIGEIHPEVLEKWDLTTPVVAAELNLGLIKEIYLKKNV